MAVSAQRRGWAASAMLVRPVKIMVWEMLFLTPLPFFQTKWAPKLMSSEKNWREYFIVWSHKPHLYRRLNNLQAWKGFWTVPKYPFLPMAKPRWQILSNLLILGANSTTFVGNGLHCCLIFGFKVVFKPHGFCILCTDSSSHFSSQLLPCLLLV